MPAVVVGPRVAALLRGVPTISRVELRASIVHNATSQNIVGVTSIPVGVRDPGGRRGRSRSRSHGGLEAAAAVAPSTIVITTPINGFCQCGGERGPGVALLLDVVRRVVADRESAAGTTATAAAAAATAAATAAAPARARQGFVSRGGSMMPGGAARVRQVRLIFAFVSGHELGSLGLRHFLRSLNASYGVRPSDVAAFFSFGANIAMVRQTHPDRLAD